MEVGTTARAIQILVVQRMGGRYGGDSDDGDPLYGNPCCAKNTAAL